MDFEDLFAIFSLNTQIGDVLTQFFMWYRQQKTKSSLAYWMFGTEPLAVPMSGHES